MSWYRTILHSNSLTILCSRGRMSSRSCFQRQLWFLLCRCLPLTISTTYYGPTFIITHFICIFSYVSTYMYNYMYINHTCAYLIGAYTHKHKYAILLHMGYNPLRMPSTLSPLLRSMFPPRVQCHRNLFWSIPLGKC